MSSGEGRACTRRGRRSRLALTFVHVVEPTGLYQVMMTPGTGAAEATEVTRRVDNEVGGAAAPASNWCYGR